MHCIVGVLMVVVSLIWLSATADVQYLYEEPGNPGRLTEVILSDGTRIQYQYDDAGNLTIATVIPVSTQIDIIVDNLDPNTSMNGGWNTVSDANAWAGDSAVRGSAQVGTFRWSPDITQPGTYEVWARWTYHSYRAEQAPYTINHAGGQSVVEVNQRDESLEGQWNLLGTYTFDASGSAYVEVATYNGGVSADAVRFISSGGGGPTTYDLTVGLQGTGSGTVTSAPAGIVCGADCTEAYTDGTSVTLSAQAVAGSSFTGWTGGCTGTGSCVVTMTSAQSVGATFDVDGGPSTYDLTVTLDGTGTGTVTSAPVGIDCGSDCAQAYDDGTAVTLSAQAIAGSTFVGWTGACSGTSACVVTLTSAQSVGATFDLDGGAITIIVDNLDANTSTNGSWTTVTDADAWAGDTAYRGSSVVGKFRWSPDITQPGTYEVWARWTYHPYRAEQAPYTINHVGGPSVVEVNQRDASLSGQWNLLGTYTFDASGSAYVEVATYNGGISADAVRLIKQ
ncbi:MAG: hypothetical protein AAF493_20275 [Pseudomonadota bacterium]